MPRVPLVLLCLPLITACASQTLAGTWEGTCDMTDPNPEHYEILLDLVEGDDGVALGQASVASDWFTGSVLGVAEGTLLDGVAEIHAELGDLSMNFILDLEGPLKRERIEGTCATEVASGTGELVRTADAEDEGGT